MTFTVRSGSSAVRQFDTVKLYDILSLSHGNCVRVVFVSFLRNVTKMFVDNRKYLYIHLYSLRLQFFLWKWRQRKLMWQNQNVRATIAGENIWCTAVTYGRTDGRTELLLHIWIVARCKMSTRKALERRAQF